MTESQNNNESGYLFTSDRLGFRLWQDKDTEPFAQLNADKDVMEFFPNTRTLEETLSFVEKIKMDFKTNGYGVYAVDTLHNKQFIGFIGLMHPRFEAWFTPCIEIGWRLKKEAWNFGYATEGAKRVLEYCFEKYPVSEIYSFTAAINVRSENVMIKSGMTKIENFPHPLVENGHRLNEHVLYKIQKPLTN